MMRLRLQSVDSVPEAVLKHTSNKSRDSIGALQGSCILVLKPRQGGCKCPVGTLVGSSIIEEPIRVPTGR